MKTPAHLSRVLTFLIGSLGTIFAAPSDTSGSKPPNIVVIMADDLGYADVGVYGCKDIPTPHIDDLANEGVRFTSAYVTGNMCGPSRAGFLTGRHQASFGYYKNVSEPLDPAQGLPEIDTIASLLQQQGYVTGGVGKWHMGTSDKQHPNAKGFDDWFGFLGGGLTYYPLDHPSYNGKFTPLKRPAGVRAMQHTLPVLHNRTPVKWKKYITHELTDAGINFLEKNHEKPFFLFLSYNTPHLELEAPAETIAKYPADSMTPIPGVKPEHRSIYAAMVDEMDDGIGQVLAKIEALDLEENTVVWFLSDHGGMGRTSDNRPFKGAKGTSFEGGLRVPMIAKWPGKLPEGAVLEHPVTSLDIGVTSIAMAGGDPEKAGLDGKDIRSYLTGQSEEAPHETLYWRTGTFERKSGVIRDGDYKLMVQGKSPQLYDLKADPSETTNLAKDKPELVQSMLADWNAWDEATSQPGLWTGKKNAFQYADYDWLKGSQHYRVSHIETQQDQVTEPTLLDRTGPPASAREFETIQLLDEFHSESAALADMDNDGDTDVVYGPFLFLGPDFKERRLIDKPNPFKTAAYSNNFFSYADDIDGDGWKDVLVLGFPRRAEATYWYKNPGKGGEKKRWERFNVFEGVGNESPVWADVTGDGKKEILCSMNGQFGFVAPADRSKPQEPWKFTAISPPKSTGGKFTHGLGFGDVNGDGRTDLLEKSGWWEQPASGGLWKKHAFAFSKDKGGSQMFAYDFDGDGDQDVITAINAHGYGLAWFEQVPAADGGIDFKKHLIMGATVEESPVGIAFSQLHGMNLADFDGDGIVDLVTGKRYFAHGGKDPGGKDPAVLYWFRTIRGDEGGVTFVPHRIHDDSGVGVDITVGDLDGDGRVDVLTGNKKGCFVHRQTDRPALPVTNTKKVAKPKVESIGMKFEGEDLELIKKAGSPRVQQLAKVGGGKWSSGKQFWWREARPGDEIVFALPVAEAGEYSLSVALTKARDYGIVQFTLDGEKLGEPLDLFSPDVTLTGDILLAEKLKLDQGQHKLGVRMTGSNPKALPKHMFGLDYVALTSPGAKATTLVSKAPVAPALAAPKKAMKEGNAANAEPQSPQAQLATFRVPEGFEVELVASEETGVPKPVSLAFDDAGRLWTQTATAYPRDRDPDIWTKPGPDRIMVIDQPHLAKPQTARVFAEGMVMPMGVLPWGGGAIVAQGPEILKLADRDGDGVADERTTLLRGFGVQDTHTLPHQLVRLPAGQIGFSQGVLNGGTIMDAAGKSHPFNKTLIASVAPDGTDLRILGVGMNNIWAWAEDRLGRVFIHEANDWGYSLVPFEQDSSYPSFVSSLIHPDAPLHPPTAQDLSLGGTGFSGIAICEDQGGSFPKPWQGRFFVANPILGKINAVSGTVDESGVWKFTKEVDLLTCEDPMFRPVAVSFGPDGCLYIADWYNRIISHNEVARDHPARDKSHGRIWRVRAKSQERRDPTNFTAVATRGLPEALVSESSWGVQAALNQIAERRDSSIVPNLIERIQMPDSSPEDRIALLRALEHLGHFDEKVWGALLQDPEPNLRREVVRSLTSLNVSQAEASPILRALEDETSWTVRYEVLRYFREMEGEISSENLGWLRKWSDSPAPTNQVKGPKGQYLALDGSYQGAFQEFLFEMAKAKTSLPVIEESKWSKVIDRHVSKIDEAALAEKGAAITKAMPMAKPENGKLLTQSLCLTCHAIGGEGVGFAPPLDGFAARDLDGAITAILHPNAAIENVFRSYQIETKDGKTFEGFKKSEVRGVITLLSMGGASQTFPIKNIKNAGYVEGRSVMPDLGAGLSPEQIASIIAYLKFVDEKKVSQ